LYLVETMATLLQQRNPLPPTDADGSTMEEEPSPSSSAAGGDVVNNGGGGGDSEFSVAVSQIVNRVALEEGHEGPATPEQRRRATLARTQGPLTPHELSKLSYLCTLGSTLVASKSSSLSSTMTSSSQSPGATTSASAGGEAELTGFATVEGDELVALIALLDRHVNIAAGVRLIDDALRILKDEEVSPSSSRKQAAAELNKVRAPISLVTFFH